MYRVNLKALQKEGYRLEYLYSTGFGEGYIFKSFSKRNKRRHFPYVFSIELWEGKPIISLPENYKKSTLFEVWVRNFIEGGVR